MCYISSTTVGVWIVPGSMPLEHFDERAVPYIIVDIGSHIYFGKYSRQVKKGAFLFLWSKLNNILLHWTFLSPPPPAHPAHTPLFSQPKRDIPTLGGGWIPNINAYSHLTRWGLSRAAIVVVVAPSSPPPPPPSPPSSIVVLPL